jgi:hypothetical protein
VRGRFEPERLYEESESARSTFKRVLLAGTSARSRRDMSPDKALLVAIISQSACGSGTKARQSPGREAQGTVTPSAAAVGGCTAAKANESHCDFAIAPRRRAKPDCRSADGSRLRADIQTFQWARPGSATAARLPACARSRLSVGFRRQHPALDVLAARRCPHVTTTTRDNYRPCVAEHNRRRHQFGSDERESAALR